MPASNITFNGINRTVSDFSNSGSCEELINLRPTDTGLHPVKDFEVMMDNIPWLYVWEHKIGPHTKYIAMRVNVTNNGKDISFWQIDENGYAIGNALYTLTAGLDFDEASVHFATMGNIFTISIADSATGTYRNISYQWKDEAYVSVTSEADTVTEILSGATLNQGDIEAFTTESSYTTEGGVNKLLAMDSINDAFNILEAENPSVAFGRFLVALCLRTTDGEEFWTSRWMGNNMDTAIKVDSLQNTDFNLADLLTNTSTPTWYEPTYVENKVGCLVWNGSRARVRLGGCSYSITLPAVSVGENSILKEICVYVSRPERYISTEDSSALQYRNVNGVDDDLIWYAPIRDNEGYSPEKQLLYLQERIPIRSLKDAGRTIDLKFGGVSQTTGRTLEVDAGLVTRYGNILSYNNRLHYYGSTSQTYVTQPSFITDGTSVTPATLLVLIRFLKGDGSSVVMNAGTMTLDSTPTHIIYPDSRVQTIYLAPALSLQDPNMYQIDMQPSDRYNFAYGTTPDLITADASLMAELRTASTSSSFLTDEPQDLNVTEQYNPFVFDVAHSYRAPGTILDVQPQMVAVPDVSFGDYPLNIFTDRGVYALLQGDGNVLYGALRPVSNLVSKTNSAVTDMGTFFVAAGGLYLLSGRTAVLVSEALHEGPHNYIRSSEAYQTLTRSNVLYNIEQYESKVPFDEFIGNCVLSFNPYRAELIVSNPNYEYSYVLSLKYRQWFKITHKFTQSTVGGDLIMNLVKLAMASADSCVLDCSNVIADGDNTSKTVVLTVTKTNGSAFSVEQTDNYESGGEGGETVPVTGISIRYDELYLPVGKSNIIPATITPANATNKKVYWTSSDPSVGTVDTAGKVRGISEGTATITARTEDGGFTATVALTVGVELYYPYFSEYHEGTFPAVVGTTTYIPLINTESTLCQLFTEGNNNYATLTWTGGQRDQVINGPTSPTDAARPTNSRVKVEANAAGTFDLVCCEPDNRLRVYSWCTIVITDGSVAVTGVSVSPASVSLNVGGTTQLTATVNPSDATDKSVSWSTSDSSVATVSNGLVTAVGAGTADITVTTTDGAKTATCRVTVTAPVAVTGVQLDKSTLSLEEGANYTLTATVAPANASNKNVTWSSSDTSVATVNSSGKVTAVAEGSAVITARSAADTTKSASCAVTVSASGSSTVTVSPTTLSFLANGNPSSTGDSVTITTEGTWTAQ